MADTERSRIEIQQMSDQEAKKAREIVEPAGGGEA
jgi:hypothetical protein